ncbi:BORE2 protein, partial [Menura novaehollandiae]|nr:BORE2 protein [Menura novaehollandiae]
MALEKPSGRRRSSDSGVEPDRGALRRDRDQRIALSQQKKNQRIALFLSDFDQQAKEHVQEMKKELDSILETAEKAFAVDLLTLPAAVRKMKRKELLSECFKHESEVVFCALHEIFNFPCLANTFLVKVTTIVEYEDAKHSSAKKITKKVSLISFYSKNIRT